MAVLHRALFTWFILLLFLILLCLRLDSRTQWNWFIVFIPMWFYDCILTMYVHFNMISHCKNGHDRLSNSIHRKIWYIIAIALKIAAQVLLCSKLEYPNLDITIYHVLLPLWILLPALFIDMFVTLIKNRNRFTVESYRGFPAPR